MLEVSGICSGYGRKQVLHGIEMRVDTREVVALLGHNGAGKSTLLDTIFGSIPLQAGRLVYDGHDMTAEPSHGRLARGIGYVGQGAPVFPRLTVHENLLMGGYGVADRAVQAQRIAHVEQVFPSLLARRGFRAGSLSGGERQMLALGMLMVAAPSLLILDEPSGGMSPLMVDRMYSAIQTVVREMHVSLLLVEQDVERALALASRVYVLANGRVRYAGTADDLRTSPARSRLLAGLE